MPVHAAQTASGPDASVHAPARAVGPTGWPTAKGAVRRARPAWWAATLIALAAIDSAAGSFTLFERTFIRDTGQPQTVTFSVPAPATTYVLRIESDRVASAVITLNGRTVVAPNDFNNNVTLIERAVTLQAVNELSVEVRGKPGGSLRLLVIGADDDPPVITAAAAPAANPAGWNNTDVTVTFTCTDAISGVASCPQPAIVRTEGAGQVTTGRAVDIAGNAATVSLTLNIDKSVPAIAPLVSPPPNAAGWQNADVTVSFACADVLSGIAGCTTPQVVSREGAGQVVGGEAVDRAGNRAGASATVNLDKTTPRITASLSAPPNPAGWHNAPVTVTFTCEDERSGIATCPAPVVVASDGAGQNISGTAVDRAGNSATTSVALNLDTKPPVLTSSLSPPPNAAGWNNADVTVAFECADGGAGVLQCPPAQVVTTEGASQIVRATATDVAGNIATAEARVSLDKTPPTITASSSPPPNANGWNSSDVTVTFACDDGLSGVADCAGPQTVIGEGADQTVTGRVVDRAGNPATTSLIVSLDKTPPTITASRNPPPNANGWNKTAVTVSFDCADAVSSIESCPPPALVLTEGAGQPISGVAVDRAGNRATTSVTLNIDLTAPTVTPVSSAPGPWSREDVTVTFSCSDAGAGIDACPDPHVVSSEGANQTITRRGTDLAGNSSDASIQVSIDRTPPTIAARLAPPLNAEGWANSDVTVSFECSDSGSGIAECPPPRVVATEGAAQTFSGTAVDAAGNPASASVTVSLDKTPPAIVATPDRPPNANGWHNAAVTVTFACSDAASDVADCPAPVTVSAEGADQVVRGTATDRAGNSAAASVVLSIDATPPIVRALAASGWSRGDVLVTFECEDGGSGVAVCPPQRVVTAEGSTPVEGIATDRAGNSATARATVQIDRTPPVISAHATPAPNAAGWNNSPVTVTFECADVLSQLASCPAAVVVSTDGAAQVISGTAADAAGNPAVASVAVNLDRAPPALSIASPADGTLIKTSPVAIAGTFTDALSGASGITCNGVPAGVTGSLFTCETALTKGLQQITVAAVDAAGNTGREILNLTFDPNNAPTARPAGPYSGETETAVAFNGAGSTDPDGQALTFVWVFGDGTTGAGPSPTHAYAEAGTYTVRLTVSDPDGATNAASTIAVIVRANRPPTANAGGPYTADSGASVSFDGSGSTDPDNDSLSFVWSFGDGTTGVGNRPVHVYGSSGTYQVTLTATDGRGGSHTASTSAVVSAAPDRSPPVISITGPAEALPDTDVTMTAQVTDNVSVASVTFEVDGEPPSEITAPPFRRQVKVPVLAVPGTSLKIKATAKDPSGNAASAEASLTIVSLPDSQNPTLSLRLPAQAVPGGTIHVAALASDNTGVASVAFAVNGQPLASLDQPPFETTFVVPVDTPVGASLSFSARCLDFSGNAAEATNSVSVVATGDVTPPSVEVTVPSVAIAGSVLPIAAAASDDVGVAGVGFFVDGVRVTFDVDAPFQASYRVPATLLPGTRLTVEAQATDFAGHQAAATSEVQVIAPGQGVLTGEVYDDTTGLPLEGAAITLVGTDDRGIPYAETSETDARGRYVIRAPEGHGVVQIKKASWSRVDRPANVAAGKAIGLVDARLTPLASAVAVSAISGGKVTAGAVELTVPPGALRAAVSIAITPISPQGLEGRLPLGWSPMSVVDVAPAGVEFDAPAQIAVITPAGLLPGMTSVLAMWDREVAEWRAVEVSQIGDVSERLSNTITRSGQYAWLIADQSPSQPLQPSPGAVLTGVTASVVPDEAQATVDPQPQIIFYQPGVKSEVHGKITAAAPLSSGTLALARINESYDFTSAARATPDPFVQDLVFYQRPGAGAALSASHMVSPSLVFEALTLAKGVITVALHAAPSGARESAVATPEGGVIASGDRQLHVPAAAAANVVPVELQPLTLAEVGVALPQGFEFIDAVLVSFIGSFGLPAALSVPRPAQLVDASSVLVARAQVIAGENRLVLVGTARVAGDRLISDIVLAGTEAALEGVRTTGRYVFVRVATPFGFAAGTVLGVSGAPFAGAMVTTNALPLVSLSQTTGRYVAAVGVGAVALTARDLVKNDTGGGEGTLAAAGQTVLVDLNLAARPPTVVASTPAAGASNVPLSDPVVVRFSEPIDPSTATAQNVRLADPGGAPVAGVIGLSGGNATLTFRPVEPLAPNTAYTFTLAQEIEDLADYGLASPFSATFTSLDTLPPPPPPAGQITATIPGADGKTTVTATQGTASPHDEVFVENLTKKTLTKALVEASGAFSVAVHAGLADKVRIAIRDRAGNQTVVDVPRFQNPDGSVAIGPEGGQIAAANGLLLDIDEGTFPRGSIVRFTALMQADIVAPMTPEYPFVTAFEINSSATPRRHMNVSTPVSPDIDPTTQGILAKVVTAFGQPALSIVDTAKIIDGRLRTSSPPCPGILEKFGRYAMYLNNDRAMARFGIALLSMAVSTYPAFREGSEGSGNWYGASPEIVIQPYHLLAPPFMLTPPIWMFNFRYFPASPFVAHVFTERDGELDVDAEKAVEAVAAAASVCLPVPAEEPVRIVIRDARDGRILQAEEETAPPAGTSRPVVANFVDPSDREAPFVQWASWNPQAPHILDAGKPVVMVFSEPVQLLKTDDEPDPIYAVADDEPTVKLKGTGSFQRNNRVLVFIPDLQLPMGKTFELKVPGLQDFAGNRFTTARGTPLRFKTFEPYVLLPASGLRYDKRQIEADLQERMQSAYNPVFLHGWPSIGLRDLDFATRRPDQSADGKWHTQLVGVRLGAPSGYKIFNFDLSNPLSPVALSAYFGGTRNHSRVKLLSDFHLRPRDLPGYSAWPEVEAWRRRQLVFAEDDPSIRLCAEPGDPWIEAWRGRHAAANRVFQVKEACGTLAVVDSYTVHYSFVHLYDVFDPTKPLPPVLGSRVLSDNGSLFSPPAPPRTWAPAGSGFARGFDLVSGVDFTHLWPPERTLPVSSTPVPPKTERLNQDTTAMYVALEGMGLAAIDLGANVPEISDFIERPGLPNSSGQMIESEGFYLYPYYQSVQIVRGRVVATGSDRTDRTDLRLLEIFTPDLGLPIATLPLPIVAGEIKAVEGLIKADANGDGVAEELDIGFISGWRGGIAVVNLTDGKPALVGLINTPTAEQPDATGTAITQLRHIAIDKEAMLAYVGGQWTKEGHPYEGLIVIDIQRSFGPSVDANADGRDDRIVGMLPITGPDLPAGRGAVFGFKLDPERKLIYAAIDPDGDDEKEVPFAIIKVCECVELETSFTLRSGGVKAPDGTATLFPSADGVTATVFVTPAALQSREVFAQFDVELSTSIPLTYSLTEVPLGDATETLLDLSNGRDTGQVSAGQLTIPMLLKPAETLTSGTLVYADFKDSRGVVLKRSALVLVPATVLAGNTKLLSYVDRVNKDIEVYGGDLVFGVSYDAKVTIRVDGNIITQNLAGQPAPIVFDNVPLPAGFNRVLITRDMVSLPGEHTFEIRATFSDQNVVAIATGTIEHEVLIFESLPVGHSFVKGVDLYDGHLTLQREDLNIPTIGPALEFTRSYSSVGRRSSGVMGAGWGHNYESRLLQSQTGKVTLAGGEGSGFRFFNATSSRDDQGRTVLKYRPQAGYHGSLQYYIDEDAFDFFTKGRTRYRFEVAPVDPAQVSDQKEYRPAFIEDSRGNRLILTYASSPPYNLQTVTDATGRTLTLTYKKAGLVSEDRLAKVEGPLDLVVTYEYDEFGNLTKAARDVLVESYEYTVGQPKDRHNLVKIIGPNKGVTGPNNDVTVYTYYSDGDAFPGENSEFAPGTGIGLLVVQQKHEFVKSMTEGFGTPEAATTTYAYDYSQHQAKLVTTVTDPRKVSTVHTIHPRGVVVEQVVKARAGDNVTRTKWSFQEDPPIDDVFITERTDPNGRVTRHEYDANGNPKKETIDLASVSYGAVTDPAGHPVQAIATQYEYDLNFNRVTKKIDPEGSITLYELDQSTGDVLAIRTNPNDGSGEIVLGYTYATSGLLKGLVKTVTDPRGNVTTYDSFDPRGNPTRVLDAAGNVTTNVFDQRSRLTESFDTFGHRSVTEYDTLDRVIRGVKHTVRQPADPDMVSADQVLAYTYFPGGQKKTLTNGLGHVTHYEYDALNRSTVERDELVDADGVASTFETGIGYDGNSNKTLEVDRRNNKRTYTYDDLNRLTRIDVAGRMVSRYAYDAAGNKISEADLHGHETRFELDQLYRRIKTILPLTGSATAPLITTAQYDRVGNILRTTDPNGRETKKMYDGVYRLKSETNPIGTIVSFEYDKAGNKVRERNEASGLSVDYTYDALNRPASVVHSFTDPLTRAPASLSTSYRYLDSDNVRELVNPKGIVVRSAYNGNEMLIEKTIDPGGLALKTTYRYDGNGNLAALKDPEGADPDLVYSFDGLNRKIKTTYLLGGEEKLFYDGNGNLSKGVDRRGITIRREYDAFDRKTRDVLVESITNAGGELVLSETQYDDANNIVRTSDAKGSLSIQRFDALHREIERTDPLNGVVRSKWDGVNKIAEVDRRSIRLEFAYDALNRLVETREFDGPTVASRLTTEYVDSRNQRIDIDRRGVETTTQLDALARVRRITRKHAALAAAYGTTEILLEETAYDGNGNKIEFRDANGNLTRFTYDNADRRTSTVEGAGSPVVATTTFTYDRANNLIEAKDGRPHSAGFDRRYTYDARNRKIAEENAAGEVVRFTYDQNDNRLTMVEPKGQGHVTTYSYDELNKLIAVDESRGGVGGVTRYLYDANRNRVAQQDAAGTLTTYRYDALNRLTDMFQHVVAGSLSAQSTRTEGAGGDEATARHWHYEYDAEHNETLIVDAEGQRVGKSYDHLNRLVRKEYSSHKPATDGSEVFPKLLSVSYEYDANGNHSRVEERKQFTAGVTSREISLMEYDPLDRLVRKTNPDQKVTTHVYDRLGNRTALTDADGVRTSYTFDARNRVSAVTAEMGSGMGITTYTYWPDNLQKSIAYPNGTTAQMTYDAVDRLVTIVNHAGDTTNPISQHEYAYDANGNPTSQAEKHRQLNGGATDQTAYAYDVLNRLTGVTYENGASVTYTYSATGNRLTEVGTSPVNQSLINRTYTYNSLNQLTQVVDGADPDSSAVFSYDANGNTVEQKIGAVQSSTNGGAIGSPVSVKSFAYDIRDQLVRVDLPSGGPVSFDYDHAGRRVKLASPFGNIRFLYDQNAVIQEYEGNSLITTGKYNYGSGLLSRVNVLGNARQSFFYLFDGRTSTSELVDEGGGIQASYLYDVWGGMRRSVGLAPNRRRFTGHYFDPETGLHYFGARYYDDKLGRFLTQDPYLGNIHSPPSLHRYAYAHANPALYTDPDGRAINLVAAGFLAAVGGIGGCVVGAIKAPPGEGLAGCGKGAAVGAVAGGLAGLTFGASMAATGALGVGVGGGASSWVSWTAAVAVGTYAWGGGNVLAEGGSLADAHMVGSVESFMNTAPMLFGPVSSGLTASGGLGRFAVVNAIEDLAWQKAFVSMGLQEEVNLAQTAFAGALPVGFAALGKGVSVVQKAGTFANQLHGTVDILSRERLSKRGNGFAPWDPAVKMAQSERVTGSMVLKDAWTLAGACLQSGVKGCGFVGGLSERSFGNFVRNITHSIKDSTSLARGPLIQKGDQLAYTGDLDLVMKVKGQPIMTDAVGATLTNSKLSAELLDDTAEHGLLGEVMPRKHHGKTAYVSDQHAKLYWKQRGLAEGADIDAVDYWRKGIYIPGQGRFAPLTKGGKPIMKSIDSNVFEISNWSFESRWLDQVGALQRDLDQIPYWQILGRVFRSNDALTNGTREKEK